VATCATIANSRTVEFSFYQHWKATEKTPVDLSILIKSKRWQKIMQKLVTLKKLRFLMKLPQK
jgi:hypothetical protein